MNLATFFCALRTCLNIGSTNLVEQDSSNLKMKMNNIMNSIYSKHLKFRV